MTTQQDNSMFPTPSDPEARAEKLREDITRTRSALSDDIKALGEKLSPDQLKEDAKEVITHAASTAREGAKHIVRDAKDAAVDSLRSAKEHAFDSISESVGQVSARARVIGRDVSDFVAVNAVPLGLLGMGVGWLLISMSHQRRLRAGAYGSDYRLTTGERAWHEARERAQGLTDRASSALSETRERLVERARDVTSSVGERAGALRTQLTQGASELGHGAAELGQRAYHGMERAGERAYHGIERAGERARTVSAENPLAIGLLALAAGAAVALLLPPTRRENALLGETRDKLLHKAQDTADEWKNSLQKSAGEIRETIGELRQPGHHA